MQKLTIIKAGSNVLVNDQGEVREEIVAAMLQAAHKKLSMGENVIIVTSGAVAMGREKMEDSKLDKRIAAGVGQVYLMSKYLEVAEKLHLHVLELLLSRPHLAERQHFLRLQEVIQNAFEKKIIPIVNDNDILTAGTDWSFGDNDSLSAALAISFGAEKLLIISNVEGLFTANPLTDSSAELISEVKNVNSEIMKYCSANISDLGSGGMLSKLKVARLCTAVGIETQIVSGLDVENIDKAMAGESVGTRFLPRNMSTEIKNRERWILAAKNSVSSIEVDEGAVQALRAGKSLLAVGIKHVFGLFKKGDLVEVVNVNNEGVAIGVVDIGSKELSADGYSEMKGLQVMHADNIMVFSK